MLGDPHETDFASGDERELGHVAQVARRGLLEGINFGLLLTRRVVIDATGLHAHTAGSAPSRGGAM
jgi:hypothetical protein